MTTHSVEDIHSTCYDRNPLSQPGNRAVTELDQPVRVRMRHRPAAVLGDMVLNILGLVVLIVAAALLAWSSVRALRNENRLLKWGGAGSAGLLAAMAFVVIVLMSAGLLKLTARTAASPNLKVAGTPHQIQRGRDIADSFCGACHSRTGTLTCGGTSARIFRFPSAPWCLQT